MDSRFCKSTLPRSGLLVGALLALVAIARLGASSTDTAMLRRIASRVDDRAGVISIEASDPVPYVASQPDPRTFVVEMRDVVAVGFADNFKVDPRVPVSGVRVENGRAFDGSSVARVSLDLVQPIRPRVRSSRNVIFIEADRLDRAAAGVVSGVGTAGAKPRDGNEREKRANKQAGTWERGLAESGVHYLASSVCRSSLRTSRCFSSDSGSVTCCAITMLSGLMTRIVPSSSLSPALTM